MNYCTCKEISEKRNLSERSVRNYCQQGRIKGVFLHGKTWLIPENSQKPNRQIRHVKKSQNLLDRLKFEKENQIKNGIYRKFQIDLAYNSNHIEGSQLTHEETRLIFETQSIFSKDKIFNIDDIIETNNHFRCFDIIIDNAKKKLNESFIKELHHTLKFGTSDALKSWFKIGDYKLLANEVGGYLTTSPDDVKKEIKTLINNYNNKDVHTLEEIIEFHVNFERIHPFQDGNGRIGRLIAFKECLKNNIIPFIIFDSKKYFYYQGLSKWSKERSWLVETCLDGQDIVKTYLDKFKVKY